MQRPVMQVEVVESVRQDEPKASMTADGAITYISERLNDLLSEKRYSTSKLPYNEFIESAVSQAAEEVRAKL